MKTNENADSKKVIGSKASSFLKIAVLIVIMVVGLAGLATGLLFFKSGKSKKTTIAIEKYTSDVSDITVPDHVKIIGLGEATHGNIEFQELKQEVFQALMENNDCRIFALEGDFGGGLRVNEYIHGGHGTARDAVAEIGFALYRTGQMEELIQWMHDYNAEVSEEEQISFYGFDMQRYDNSKEILFSYLEQAGSSNCSSYQEKLAVLNDDTVYDQDHALIKEALTEAEVIQSELEEQKASFIAATGEKQYEIALECLHAIMQNAVLQTSSDYGNSRDGYMKERVNWIYKFEGEQKIFITGHDGHIDKSGAVKAYTSMGKRLADEYGDDYFAIGTDFLRGEVNVVTSSGERKNTAIENSNDITALYENLTGNVFYLDYTKTEACAELQTLLSQKQNMVNIGSNLDDYQKAVKAFYTLNMCPKQAYDSLIIVKQVTPTAPWSMD